MALDDLTIPFGSTRCHSAIRTAMDDPGFRIQPKRWDSDFFGRAIHELVLGKAPDARRLSQAIASLDQEAVWGLEAHLQVGSIDLAPTLEDLGFRLVDSRMVFVSTMTREEIPARAVPYGKLRLIEADDVPRIDELTARNLVDNRVFKSRYNDRRLFSRAESVRYYAAWNQLAFSENRDLFAVWEVDGEVVGYYNYLRKGTHAGLPLFKGGLTTVDESHRGHGVQNVMQVYLFREFGVPTWALDNTTQISNVSAIKNHIESRKEFQDSILTFYRVNVDREVDWYADSGRDPDGGATGPSGS